MKEQVKVSKDQAKAILDCAPKRATHFSCLDGVISYYSEREKIDVWHASFLKVFSDITLPSISRLSNLENQMNIDNLATQTPEEKEALDSIKSVHLRDYQKADKPRAKVEYEKRNFECAWHAIKAFEDGEKLYTKRSHKDFILIDNAQDVIRFLYSIYERIEYDESPQQREERERLEAAEDLYITYMSEWEFAQDWRALDEINKSAFLAIVDKTNYRKESN